MVMSMAGLQNLRSLGLSRAVRSAPDNARGAVLCRTPDPIPVQSYSRGSGHQEEKRTLPWAPTSISEFTRVAAMHGRWPKPTTLSAFQFRIIEQIPFQEEALPRPKPRRHSSLKLTCPLGPTHPCPTAVHMEPFPTSVFKFKFSFEYLLLPRSAPAAVPPGLGATLERLSFSGQVDSAGELLHTP